ncbi:MAG: hypothetical protein Q9166_006202 [cf. Caloplaca sp. 2 TL-2023]
MSLATASFRVPIRFSILNLLIWVASHSSIIHGAVIRLNRFPPSPNSYDLSVNASQVDFHCVHQPQWRDIEYFNIRDCFGAIYFMQYTEGVDPVGPEVLKEFKTRSAASVRELGEPVLTPRKYVTRKLYTLLNVRASGRYSDRRNNDESDSCTLAVLMRSEARPGDLPAEEDRSTLSNDVSSYETLATAAGRIWDMCGKGLKSPGWATVGKFSISNLPYSIDLERDRENRSIRERID